jgi:hypothetical protein
MDVAEDVAQERIELERELLHAERILRLNISSQAYLRCGPFEEFDSSVIRHSIGSMDVMCPKCFALRFACESPTFCCKDGKLDLPRRANPPPVLKALMEDETTRG